MDLDGLPVDEAEFLSIIIYGYLIPYREDEEDADER